MEAKIALGKLIVADFHSAAEADARGRGYSIAWCAATRRPRISRGALPGARVKAGGIRVDKLLARIGLAESVSDAARKIKAGARGDQRRANRRSWPARTPPGMVVQVGKNWRKVIR